MRASGLHLPQRLTAFACARDHRGRILLVRHRRLGVLRWEVPGGHVEPNERVVDAAVRETLEETGRHVRAGRMIAECRHRWNDRVVDIIYFSAEVTSGEAIEPPRTEALEPEVEVAAWIGPDDLKSAEVSTLAMPVISHLRSGDPRTLRFDATHRLSADGWQPVVTRTWFCEQQGSVGRPN